MALDGQIEIFGAYANTVVDDADERAAAGFDGDIDAPRAGIERVLDKLLHHGGGPLDDLARGDAIDKNWIETADRHAVIHLL